MSTKDYYVWGHQNERLESHRLSHQHFAFRSLFGGLLQPSIMADLESRTCAETIRIADVACGNCIWAHDVATSDLAKSHNVWVTALDMTDELFPTEDERPGNIEYALWDMYTPPPSQYLGTFDVVNIRLIFGAVRNNNPKPILQNLLQLLKPNGWLQWSEYDADNPVAPADSEYLRTRDLFSIARAGHSNAWVPRLGEILKEASMKDVMSFPAFSEKHMLKYWKDNWYVGLLNLVRVVNNEKVDEIWNAMEKERAEKGLRLMYPVVMAIGRKA